jgi:hypothetical protein
MPMAAKPFFIPVVHSPPGAVGHVAAPELLSHEGRAQSRGTRAAPELPSQEGRAQSHGTRGSAGAHLSKEARSGATEHMMAPEPTSAGRCGPKLQLMWQYVGARPAPCLDLELVCGGTRSSGYRQLGYSPLIVSGMRH